MKLFHREFGQGKPLLIVHGLFGSSDNWVTIGRKLSTARRVFLVDLRNHGRSFHSEEFNLNALAHDILVFVNSVGLERIDIMGHSLGGKAAMSFSLENDRLLDKLIVVDIAPKLYPVHHRDLVQAMLELDVKSLSNRKQADWELGKSIASLAVRQFLLKNLAKDEDGSFFWRLNLAVISNELHQIGQNIDATASISNQTLFIRGSRSDYIEVPEDLKLIHALFPNYQIQELDAGHWLHAEKPVEFSEIVQSFLDQG